MFGAAALQYFRDALRENPAVPPGVTSGEWDWYLVPSHINEAVVPAVKRQQVALMNERGVEQHPGIQYVTIHLNKHFRLNGVPYIEMIALGWSPEAEMVLWQVL